jgi:membrane protein YdbS with pleckstrin-like domain
MRPRIRRLRRWAFLVTVPAGLFGAKALGIDLNVRTGLKAGIALATLDLAVLLAVVAIGTRVLGRERRDVLLDFLMHPTARRAIAAEARTLLTVPRALGRRLRQPSGREFAYHRGTNELGFVLALLPAALAEGAAVHLLLHGAPTWLRLAIGALHLYGVLMVLGLALGPRVHPHRVTDQTLHLRAGQLTRANVPLELIAAIGTEHRRMGRGTGLVLGDGEALLLSDGRADVRVELLEPVFVERALRDPVSVTSFVVAVDDERALAEEVWRAQARGASEPAPRPSLLGWLTPSDLFEAATA